MNGLFRNSTLSFASSTQVQSVVSDPTTNSSDDTVRGLGSLGGKVIYAFGEATLRGLENLAIRRKLRTINHIFPHDDSATIKNVKGLYDDVLELSRFVEPSIFIISHHYLLTRITVDLVFIEHKYENRL